MSSHTCRLLAGTIAISFIAASVVAADRPSTTTAPTGGTRLEYRIDAFVDLYQSARCLATDGQAASAEPFLQPAVEAAGRIHEVLGKNLLAWSALDRELVNCRSGADLLRAFEALPEPLPLFGGRSVSVRAEAVRFAQGLVAAEPEFRETVWAEREQALKSALARIEAGFTPKETDCLNYVLESLEIKDPGDRIAIYLVAQVSAPGAVTMPRHDGGGACFVSVARPEHAGTLLFETVLHESIHALDLRTRGQAHALSELRRALIRANIAPNDPRIRHVPHTIMFVQAGETIRRVVDPSHRHYGEESGYYERMGELAAFERSVWEEYLDGKLNRQDAIARIVSRAVETDAASDRE